MAAEEDWRRKYIDSLRAIEDETRQYRAELQSLQGLAGRLCAAAQGQSPELDVVLKRLRVALRHEAKGAEIEALSTEVADAVRVMDGEPGDDAAPAPASVATVAPVSAFTPVSAPGPAVAAPGTAMDHGLHSVLSRLLMELRQDPQFAGSADAIEPELADCLAAGQVASLVERIGGLLVLRIRTLEKARYGLEQVLGQMMAQLDSLVSYVSATSAEESDRSSSNDTLRVQITGEVRALGDSVATGSDLDAIRRQMRERLKSIGQHLESFHAREAERARQARERTALMRARMDEMESEARALQARLSDEKRLALLDPLTQIPNRLAWEQRMAQELTRWQRFHQPTCVVAWDIDNFKTINDSYGHRAGDKVLTVVAETLGTGIRGTDFVARYGGEEFVMLLPGTQLADGVSLVDRMREAVAQIGFHFRGTPVSVTISCGITQLREGDDDSQPFDRADKAMYRAKESGRNRVVSA